MMRKLQVGISHTTRGRAPSQTPHRWAWLEPKPSEQDRSRLKTSDRTSPVSTPAVRQAQVVLAQVSTAVLGEAGIDSRVQGQVLRFLQRISKNDTISGSIAPDEDGVASLHWVAGKESLHIEIGDEGPSYLWSRGESGQTRRVTDPKPIYNLAESILGRMTADVLQVKSARVASGGHDGSR